MKPDISRWRLPGWVEVAFQRDSVPHAEGVVPLRTGTPPAVGQVATIEVRGFGTIGSGLIQGPIEDIALDGSLSVRAKVTTPEPAQLDRAWNVRLAYADEPLDPKAFEGRGCWMAERMSAQGVVTMPRRWPALLVADLRSKGLLDVNEKDVDDVQRLLRTVSLPCINAPTTRQAATATAQEIVTALESSARVQELFFDSDELLERLMKLWST